MSCCFAYAHTSFSVHAASGLTRWMVLPLGKRNVPTSGVKLKKKVGAPGFEPGTSCSQSRRAAGLRYAPTINNYS